MHSDGTPRNGLWRDCSVAGSLYDADTARLLERFITASPIGMHFYRLTGDGQLIIMGANPAADRLLHIDHRQFVGQDILTAFPGLTDTDIPANYRRVAKEGGSWKMEQDVASRFSGKRLTGFIQKPYQMTQFLQKLRGLLDTFYEEQA